MVINHRQEYTEKPYERFDRNGIGILSAIKINYKFGPLIRLSTLIISIKLIKHQLPANWSMIQIIINSTKN